MHLPKKPRALGVCLRLSGRLAWAWGTWAAAAASDPAGGTWKPSAPERASVGHRTVDGGEIRLRHIETTASHCLHL